MIWRPLLILASLVFPFAAIGPVTAQDAPQSMRVFTETELVDGSDSIFVARIDEITCCGIASNGTLAFAGQMLECSDPCVEYFTSHSVTVLDVLRGNLEVGQSVSVEQNGGTVDGNEHYYAGDGPMAIGEEYLFFAKYIPGLMPSGTYSIRGPGQGNIRLDNDPNRDETIAHWSDVLESLPCDVPDALVRGSVTYGRMRWNDERRYVPRALIADQIGVTGSRPNANPCRGELSDLEGTVLASGSGVFAIDGYAPGFRLAAFDGERYLLYQAVWDPGAKTAEDLYGIRDRVDSIGFTPYSNCLDFWTCDFLPNPRAAINVAALTDLFLSSPVNPDAVIPDGWDGRFTGLIYFYLDDGTVATVWFDGTHSLNGIVLPPGFVDALFRAPVEADV